MTIIKDFQPSNTVVNYHRVVEIKLQLGNNYAGPARTLTAQVHSFTNEAAMMANRVSWQEYPEIPLEVLQSNDPLLAAELYLIKRSGSFLENGIYAVFGEATQDIEKVRLQKTTEITKAFNTAAEELIAGYPEIEKLTWTYQHDEAVGFHNDAEAPTPFLDSVAAARGIDRVTLIGLAYNNAVLFKQVSADLIGRRQAIRDKIVAAVSINELNALSWGMELPNAPEPV